MLSFFLPYSSSLFLCFSPIFSFRTTSPFFPNTISFHTLFRVWGFPSWEYPLAFFYISFLTLLYLLSPYGVVLQSIPSAAFLVLLFLSSFWSTHMLSETLLSFVINLRNSKSMIFFFIGVWYWGLIPYPTQPISQQYPGIPSLSFYLAFAFSSLFSPSILEAYSSAFCTPSLSSVLPSITTLSSPQICFLNPRPT